MSLQDQGYASRVAQQVKQFSSPEELKKLPPIYHYWMKKYVRPKFLAVSQCGSVLDFYVEQIYSSMKDQESGLIVSLAAGDGAIEEEVATKLVGKGLKNFIIRCLELSSVRIERAVARVRATPVARHLDFVVADLNSWIPDCAIDGVIAHHSLHHIVALEPLFSGVVRALRPSGVFVSADMIGRNGHMRWPEAEQIISRLWKILPDRYKTQHQFGKFHADFINWDCSNKGFEGIRAQDVLRLLIEHFDFSLFLAYGNLPDMFVERGYGHNLDPGNPFDTDFIEFIEYLNELLIDGGIIKPTMMIASMRKKGSSSVATKCYKHWTPDFCTRRVV